MPVLRSEGDCMSEYIIDMSSSSHQSESGLLCADVSQLREEIVRCRDCERCVIYDTWNPEGTAFNCNRWRQDVEPDGFCAWGERK